MLADNFLLVALWLGRWCAILVSQVRFLACLVQSYCMGEPDHAAAFYHVFVNYKLTIL